MPKNTVSKEIRTITLCNNEFPYIVIYRHSKNMYVRYKKDHYEVSCPYLTRGKDIVKFFEEKEMEIFMLYAKYIASAPYTLFENMTYTILEKEYIVKYASRPRIDDDIIYIKQDDQQASLNKAAGPVLLEYINERVDYYYPLMYNDYNFPKISLKKVKTYYGLCNFKTRHIVFNIALAFTKKDLVDYVIVHELCHLKYHDHQQGFKNFFRQIMPDFHERQKRLKEEVKL